MQKYDFKKKGYFFYTHSPCSIRKNRLNLSCLFIRHFNHNLYLKKEKLMQSTLKTLAIGVAMTGSLFIGPVAMADGAALYTAKLCQTCHGVDAKTPLIPQYPKLVGQSEIYLLQQMKDIRDGKRTNGLSAAMKALTMTVTDDEFATIAKWLVSLK